MVERVVYQLVPVQAGQAQIPGLTLKFLFQIASIYSCWVLGFGKQSRDIKHLNIFLSFSVIPIAISSLYVSCELCKLQTKLINQNQKRGLEKPIFNRCVADD